MLDLDRYDSLGAALADALARWPDATCLIESNRDRENHRLTYREFDAAARRLAGWLAGVGFAPGDRAAIVMTNQSKWLIAACGVFFRGGVLVPLDCKLDASEQLRLLAHCGARVLVVEYHLWKLMTAGPEFADRKFETVIATDAPPSADLAGATRWEDCSAEAQADVCERRRSDVACIVYSSGTGGRPKGCMLTHGNYLSQCRSLMSMFSFGPGDTYLSILPTNHAIDFMVGFIGPFVCGATVVHLRSLRPEFIRDAFTRYRISYMALVPMVLQNLHAGLQARFDALPALRRKALNAAIALNRRLTRSGPRLGVSRRLLRRIHAGFGGNLKAFFVGGAFTQPHLLRYFYDLGIPVANGYGLTEAGTALTLNDLRPFRDDTVGQPLPGVELRIVDPDATGVGEVAVCSDTVMAGYLDDSELTAETIIDGWLMTGDLGRIDSTGHLVLMGRKKNMIVTAGGKNVYPEDVESAFVGLNVKEHCVFASNYLWPRQGGIDEQLVIVLRTEADGDPPAELVQELNARNRRLPDYKRVGSYVLWNHDFPRTASMKIKRDDLARQIAQTLNGPTAEAAT